MMRVSALLLFVLTACSSEPKRTQPEWLHQPTRVVDGGYIVYVGSAAGPNADRAQFKAEGVALEDLANECSLLPKGTRIEDRYTEPVGREFVAYVKLAVEFQDCEAGRTALQPETIRAVANVSFTAQLKRYQDYMETGELSNSPGEAVAVAPPTEDLEPPPARDARRDETLHFYMTRQYVAYQKEVVVLAPPTAYAPNSPETKQFVAGIAQPSQQLTVMEKNNPQLKAAPKPWSHLTEKPALARPKSLQPAHAPRAENARPRPMERHTPARPAVPGGPHSGGGHRRRHR